MIRRAIAKNKKTANRNKIIFFFIFLLSCAGFRYILIAILGDFFRGLLL